jgi:DivIVA domain-containing protein
MLTSSDVAAVTFATVRWREGYDIDQVTALLAAAGRTLAGYETRRPPTDPVSSEQITGSRFDPTKFREGWDQDEVDDYLELLAAALREHEGRR